jgi:hypothetical protein
MAIVRPGERPSGKPSICVVVRFPKHGEGIQERAYEDEVFDKPLWSSEGHGEGNKMKQQKTQVARGWGLRVGGPLPYLALEFSLDKERMEEEVTEAYHRPVRVILVPLAEYRRLKRIEKTKQ